MRGKKQAANTDAVLAKAIERVNNVTLGYFFHTTPKDVEHLKKEDIARKEALIGNSRYPIVQTRAEPDKYNMIYAYAAETNLPELSEAAVNNGYFNAFPDPDGVIRWAPLVMKMGENYYFPMSIAVLLQYLDMPAIKLVLNEAGVESIQIEDVQIPVDESGRLLINYLGPAKTFPHYSIADIIHGRLSPDLFRDKIVIVGATGDRHLRSSRDTAQQRLSRGGDPCQYHRQHPAAEFPAAFRVDDIPGRLFHHHPRLGCRPGCAQGQGDDWRGLYSDNDGGFCGRQYVGLYPLSSMDEHGLSCPDHGDDLPDDYGVPLCNGGKREKEGPRRLPVLPDGLGYGRDPERSLQAEAGRRQEGLDRHVLRYPGIHEHFREADAAGACPSPQRVSYRDDGHRL